jgi:hypothetical protein
MDASELLKELKLPYEEKNKYLRATDNSKYN